MRGAILPLPQYVFIAWFLVKHRENFSLASCLIRSRTSYINLIRNFELFVTESKEPEPRLMCGAIPPFPQYVFIAWFLVV
jgi:hypothetical protein